MNLTKTTVLLTGACGGIGSSLLDELIKRNVKKIYAAGINMGNLDALQRKYPDKVVPIKLDVTNMNDILACHAMCDDTEILINNADVECATHFLEERSLKASQLEMSVNYFGVHNLCHTFWNSLKAKQSACIVNMLSVASFAIVMKLGTYCASKSAAHFLTQSLREAANNTNINVFGVYPGYVDTPMTKNINVDKATPQQIAIEVCDGIEHGVLDIFPDEMSKNLVLREKYNNKIFREFTE